MRICPQIRETRRTVRDSDSGLEQMSIGHHIRERAHIMQRSRNHRTGDQEERQDYINMDESEYCPCPPHSKPRCCFPTSTLSDLVLPSRRWCSRLWWWVEARDIPFSTAAGAGLPTSRKQQWPPGWRDSSCNPGPWRFSLQTVPPIRLVNPEQILWGVQRGHPQIYLHALVSLNKFFPRLPLCSCLLAIWFFFFIVPVLYYFEVLVGNGFSHLRAGENVNFEKSCSELEGGSCLS